MAKEVRTLCPYCGVGCGLIAIADGNRVLRVRGDPLHPANFGKVCPKGGTVAQTINVPSRLGYAMIRDSEGSSPDRQKVLPRAAAVRFAADRLQRILREHGPGAIGFYLSGQLTTETQYLFNKFAKGSLRTNHCDSNSRLCMASASSGMKLSLGSDGPPTCYQDIEEAEAFFFIGSNAADCHPITFDRVVARARETGGKIVVADPRRTRTAERAAVHLALRPQTDLALLNGLLRLLRDWGRVDPVFIEKHTEGWESLSHMLDEYPAERVAQICGIEIEKLTAAARILADTEKLLTFWTMGVSQTLQGTFCANAIINLHLATGRIGKPGCGPFSLTGQPNAMGGRDVGYMSHLLPGQRSMDDADDRAAMESLWNLAPGSIDPRPGLDAVAMFEAMERGEIKALWIVGSNPAASMPNLPMIRRALARAELVIVQDAYHPTETSRYAHVVFPAAVNLEEDGTFCNSERRVTLMQEVVPPPGEAQPDWMWAQQVAASMGLEAGMQFASAAAIFDEFAKCTADRPNDQSGLSHEFLRTAGPQLWPHPAGRHADPRRFVGGQFPTASGRAQLWARPYIPPEEPLDEQFPLALTTGRTLNQWHTRTKTGEVPQLNIKDPAPYLQMHPIDAAAAGLLDGQTVRITSRRGEARSILRVDEGISPGCVFLPIHWNELWAAAASPNEVTNHATDAISKQPVLKYCAVSIAAVSVAAVLAPESPPALADDFRTVGDSSPSPGTPGEGGVEGDFEQLVVQPPRL